MFPWCQTQCQCLLSGLDPYICIDIHVKTTQLHVTVDSLQVMAKIRQLNKEEKACMQRLTHKGMSHADIATIYSIDQTKIWRVVKQGPPLLT